MRIPRMAIEAESPEQLGYDRIRYNLTESSIRDRDLSEFKLDLGALTLGYGDHLGRSDLRQAIATRAGGGLTADDVLLTAGASAALFIIALTLLDAQTYREAALAAGANDLVPKTALTASLMPVIGRIRKGLDS